MADAIRIGKISSINYSAGKARVTYEDRGKSTTAELPFVAWEYWMPEIGDQVIVAHLSNGSAYGVILGPLWHSAHVPATSGIGIYCKEMSSTPGRATITHSDDTGVLQLRGDHVELVAGDTTLTVEQIEQRLSDLERLLPDNG